MRHGVVLVLFLFALGALRMVGCGEEGQLCGDGQDCDDGNPCTRDWCWSYDPDAPITCEVMYRCRHSPADDGTPCGSGKVCVEGVCGENLCKDVVCDDGSPCTEDDCNFRDGSCSYEPVWDLEPCDFGGVPGVCVDGECREDACYDVVCDENECTEDFCDPVTGCGKLEDGTPCNGGDGACLNGVCKPHPCEPASEEVLQCPITGLENWFCCPGSHLCQQSC